MKDVNSYYRIKYSTRVQKVTVSLPFTCPTLDGAIGTGGCWYCGDGSLPHGNDRHLPLAEQLRLKVEGASKRYGNDTLMIVYFQTNTNTYESIQKLRKIYCAPLKHPEVIGIAIGTRPDCLSGEIIALLTELRDKYKEIWLELGLQSSSDTTLKRVNRGHDSAAFADAVKRAKAAGLYVAGHMIAGFPWESAEAAVATAHFMKKSGVDAVKIHPFHVVEGSQAGEEYKRQPMKLLSMEEYTQLAADIIGELGEEMLILRYTAEPDGRVLIAPEYCKPEFKDVIKKRVGILLERRRKQVP